MHKMSPNPCTYAAVWKTVAYEAAHKVFKQSNGKICSVLCRMVLEWREHEHGEVEEAVRVDLMAQQALHACGLYKFWCLGSLRVEPRLLQMLVDY